MRSRTNPCAWTSLPFLEIKALETFRGMNYHNQEEIIDTAIGKRNSLLTHFENTDFGIIGNFDQKTESLRKLHQAVNLMKINFRQSHGGQVDKIRCNF